MATKFRTPMRNGAGEERNRRGASRRWIVQALEESLRRLGTDHVDLYQLHRPDPATDPEETLGALSDLVRQGKVRAIGASATEAERIVEWQWLAERRHLERMRCEQAPYNLFRRRIERNVLPTCRRYGVGVITYGPLDGSWLTGRYRSAADVPLTARLAAETDRRHGGWDPESEANRRKGELLAPLLDLAEGAGLPLTHLATAFTLAHPDVTSVIIGPRTPEQLQDSLAAADLRLDDDVLDRIDQIVTPGTDVIANHAQTAPPRWRWPTGGAARPLTVHRGPRPVQRCRVRGLRPQSRNTPLPLVCVSNSL